MFPNFLSTEQAAEYVRNNINWSLREPFTLRPNLLPKAHHGLLRQLRASRGDVPEGPASPQTMGHHPQFCSLPALIDGREQSMTKTKTTARLRSTDEFLAEGTSEGNPCSSSGSHRSSEISSFILPSTSSSSKWETSSSGRAVLKKRGRTLEKVVHEVVAEGIVFLGLAEHLDI
ncbi:hypothetical protein Cgig2_006570 [Carnegiea gigantea]|uniref:Uncharacterized protein n=1 Tax=Carnegiea gigantea TaxID=171969 RepID=A0A9Q1GV48_9CARY|nr:hypothetical protein Cgig2_006570 [Carnegiea gigantea]